MSIVDNNKEYLGEKTKFLWSEAYFIKFPEQKTDIKHNAERVSESNKIKKTRQQQQQQRNLADHQVFITIKSEISEVIKVFQTDIVWFQKVSIPTSWMVTGNSEGGGLCQWPIFLKESMELSWKFWRGGGRVQTKKPSMEAEYALYFWNHMFQKQTSRCH